MIHGKRFDVFAVTISLCFATHSSSAQESGCVIGWGSQVVGVDLSGPFISVAAGGSNEWPAQFDTELLQTPADNRSGLLTKRKW